MKLTPGLLVASLLAATLTHAQQQPPAPGAVGGPAPGGIGAFKLGTFERGGRAFVGIVLRESVVIDFAAAHKAVTPASNLAAPADMKDLIARYDQGLRTRIGAIVRAVEAAKVNRPAYVYDVPTLKILPPIMPAVMLNAAVNYAAHDAEVTTALRDQITTNAAATAGGALPGTRSAPGIWERASTDTRWNPYLFVKLPSAIIAEGEAIRLPPGRTQVDWECEMGAVLGRQSARVPVNRAAEHIFGYTIQNDVSDRGGRGDTRYGSDWLVSKNHDTFAPLGPFITPREFVPDPQKLTVRFSLNGEVMQEANTSLMIHNVFELVAYASSIMTLGPGDIVVTGTPAGVGSARVPPVYFKPGDRSVCTYEGVGTLTNPVVAG